MQSASLLVAIYSVVHFK